MDLQERTKAVKFLFHDRDTKFTAAWDALFTGTGIRTLRSPVQAPRANAIMERWIGSCRRELLDRTLIWNQRHLLHVLREYETHYNENRPHRSLQEAAPLRRPNPSSIWTLFEFSGEIVSAASSTNTPWSRKPDAVFGTYRATSTRSTSISARLPLPARFTPPAAYGAETLKVLVKAR